MLSKFLRRPVLAIVISLVIVFLGILSAVTLPVSQFPKIAPPRVIVFVTFQVYVILKEVLSE
jgi:HAE1 family hydrophobic/amphiphilic exporter-1